MKLSTFLVTVGQPDFAEWVDAKMLSESIDDAKWPLGASWVVSQHSKLEVPIADPDISMLPPRQPERAAREQWSEAQRNCDPWIKQLGLLMNKQLDRMEEALTGLNSRQTTKTGKVKKNR